MSLYLPSAETSPIEQPQLNTGGSESSATSPRENNSSAEASAKRPPTSSQPSTAMSYSNHPTAHHSHHQHPRTGVPSGSSGQAPPVVTIAPTPSLTSSYLGSDRKVGYIGCQNQKFSCVIIWGLCVCVF